jgi:esterase/lipase
MYQHIIFNKKKFIDPKNIKNTYKTYDGQIEQYQFETPYFQNLYDKIQEKLDDNQKLKYIVASVAHYDKHPTHNRYNILAYSENKNIIWYKSSGPSIGSDNNYMFIFDDTTKKYIRDNTSCFIK